MPREHRNQQESASRATKIDSIDREIIAILQSDGRRSFTRVGEQLGVSESVVRYRVQRLERAGVLQIVAVADPLKVGFEFMAFIGTKVAPGHLDAVIAAVVEIRETSYVANLAGSFDLIVEVICRDAAHFSDVLTKQIQAIPGIVDTQSFVELGIHKMSYGWATTQRRSATVTVTDTASDAS